MRIRLYKSMAELRLLVNTKEKCPTFSQGRTRGDEHRRYMRSSRVRNSPRRPGYPKQNLVRGVAQAGMLRELKFPDRGTSAKSVLGQPVKGAVEHKVD